jgi:hypothetical protein
VGTGELSVLSVQCCCEPQTAFKYKPKKKKKKKRKSNQKKILLFLIISKLSLRFSGFL